MIVDIKDLDFKRLQLGRSYEETRYAKGNILYRRGSVEIQKVELNEDNTYTIEANVKGSQEQTYQTTLLISGNFIQDSSCTCLDYKAGNLCKHIIATSMEAIAPHYASTIEGKKEIEEKREMLRRKKEEERKRLEYEGKYRNSLKTINLYKDDEKEKELYKLDLEELYKQTINEKKNKQKFTQIKIEYTIEIENSESLTIKFKIGTTRMYILHSIDDFYQAYKNEEEIYYGKQLSFIPKREIFEEESQKLFDFIIKYAEILEYIKRYENYAYSYTRYNREMVISSKNIDEFFDITKGKSYETPMGEYKFTDEKLEIKGILKKEIVKIPDYSSLYGRYYERKLSEEYTFRLNIADYEILISDEKMYIFYQNKIYELNKDKKLLKLFRIFENDDVILVPEDKLEEFKKVVLPNIKYLETENLPEDVTKEGIIANKLASKILLDTDDTGNILLELKFCYLNKEFNILDEKYKDYVTENHIIRDIPLETEVIKRIFIDGFELNEGKKEFVMKDADDIYEFLQYKIEGYMKDYEVLATDRFKNKEIKQPKISNIGIRVDNGLLELDISKINIDTTEIKDILKDYNIKKKYHKLKNGDLLDLTNSEDLKILNELSTTLDIDYSKMKNGVVNLPVNRSIYLEKLLSDKGINTSTNEEFTKLIGGITNSENSEEIIIDEELDKKLREYQKIGYKWLKTLAKYKFGGILADDMGLGKTLQIIAILKDEQKAKEKTTSIVVCPSTLVLNWKSEIEKWCDKIKIMIITGTAEERKEKLNHYEDYDLVITSYDLLKKDVANYEDKKFKYIIADEAQYIKNATTQNATSLKSLEGEIRFALTGTPIENSIAELWSIFDFVMPGYLYNYNKFKKKFEEPILKDENKEKLIQLKKLISPFVLRRVKKDVLTELPEKNITIMKSKMEAEQEKIYSAYLAQTKKEISEELENSSFEKSKFKILMLLTRLRQICCHPSLFIENYNGGCGKLNQCIDLTIDAIEAGHKVLIFSSYTSMFEIIEKELQRKNIKYFKLVGETQISKRIDMVDEFNNKPEIKVFLISLKAGGTGLNLTSADVVIHYDPWWNISSENQATDRAYRIGQKNSVQVYKLITNNSIEEKINKMQERKEKLSKDILSTEETFISKMSKKEILDLFE